MTYLSIEVNALIDRKRDTGSNAKYASVPKFFCRFVTKYDSKFREPEDSVRKGTKKPVLEGLAQRLIVVCHKIEIKAKKY